MSKTQKNEAAVETQEVAKTSAEWIKEFGGVSKAIRGLAAMPEFQKNGKVDRGAIAKAVGKRYQHVRNVLTQELKKPAV